MKELNADILELVLKDDLESEIQQASECWERMFKAPMQKDCALTSPFIITPTTTAQAPLEGEPHDWTVTGPHGAKVKLHNFNYLSLLLEHTALDVIAGLTTSAVNYREAVEILHEV